MDIKRILASKPAVVALLIGVAFLANLRYQQYRDQRAIEAEKQALVQQASDLQQKNQQLSQSLSYLDSDSFKERIARQQLNLKREGEIVYTFTEGQQATGTVIQQAAPVGSEDSNLAQWWQYFFGNH